MQGMETMLFKSKGWMKVSAEKGRQAGSRCSNRFLAYGEVWLSIQINAFLYYLSRLPVLGKIVHTSWYSRYRLKKIWSLISLAFGFIKSALANNIGTWIMIYAVPHLFIREGEVTAGVYLVLFLLLKCVGGALLECGIFKTSAEDHTFLNHFMVNPITYYQYKAAKGAFFSSIMLFPVIYFLFRDWGMAAALVLFKLFCILGGNVVYLSFYKKYRCLPAKRVRQIAACLVILSAYVGAFLGFWQDAGLPPAGQLALGAGSAVFSAVCWMYHLRYSDYKSIAVKFADPGAVTFQITVQSSAAEEAANGLQEYSWEENRDFFNAYGEEAPEQYLDRAFFRRFGKELRKERRDRALVLLLIGLVLGLGIRLGWFPVTEETVLDYSPVLIALATSMTFSGRLMQMYFRSIDLHMLYHHMATPEFIRRSMLRRYFYILKTDLFSAAALAADILLMLFLSGLRVPAGTVLGLMAVCIVFLVFWETYECIVYYGIQPYAVDMTAKSPVFTALGYLEGIFYLLVLLVRRDLTEALPWVCGACVGAVAAFFLCRRFAPKTFLLR